MMGRLEGGQERLFYNIRLEDQVPLNHLVRKLDAVLDFDGIRSQLKPFYSEIGRPSVDPELMVRMLLLGYCYSIRSERKLCEEVRFNLAYKWFCGLGFEDEVPDHSTFSVNRHGRFREAHVFRLVFEGVVASCMEVGLVGGEGFAVDASVIEADASRYKRVEGVNIEWNDKQRACRPVREYLAALETENPPIDQERKPKALSPSDPLAAWTARGRHKVQFGYSVNYLLDLAEGVIVDVEATPTRISKEVGATQAMIERTGDRLGLKPERLAGDVAYGTGELLGWLVGAAIEPHVPVWDKSSRDDGSFSRADFTYDARADVYVCPKGRTLKTTGRVHAGKTRLYRASKADCDPCPLKHTCCPNTPSRKIPRDLNQDARDYTQGLTGTEAYRRSACERKMIETSFGDLKRNLGLTRLRLRGLTGASDEFLLAATVQNLKRLVRTIWPPPAKTVIA